MIPDSVIDAYVSRIGWTAPSQPSPYTLTAENADSDSGRTYDSFHPAIIPDNIAAWMPISHSKVADVMVSNEELNAYLTKMTRQAVLAALDRVFNTASASLQYDVYGNIVDFDSFDYTALLSRRASIMDCALGLQLAFDGLQLAMSTGRSNARERTGMDAAAAFQQQQGFFDANGRRYAPGVEQKLEACIEGIIKQLFPNAVAVTGAEKPTIRALNKW